MIKQSELDEIFDEYIANAGWSSRTGSSQDYTRETLQQAIIDWHNKQTIELLDKLVQVHRANPLWLNMTQRVIPLSAIEAERNKLKESK